jgi:hypothetical protein
LEISGSFLTRPNPFPELFEAGSTTRERWVFGVAEVLMDVIAVVQKRQVAFMTCRGSMQTGPVASLSPVSSLVMSVVLHNTAPGLLGDGGPPTTELACCAPHARRSACFVITLAHGPGLR